MGWAWAAVRALSELASASYPDVLIASYNIMMVGTTSTVWKDHPDFVSFDRFGAAVVDTTQDSIEPPPAAGAPFSCVAVLPGRGGELMLAAGLRTLRHPSPGSGWLLRQ